MRWTVAIATAAAVVGGFLVAWPEQESQVVVAARRAPVVIPTPVPTRPFATPRPVTAPTKPACARVSRPFAPRTIAVPGVATGSVISPPRDAAGVPGVAPLSQAGKLVFAWDRDEGARPGDAVGNVLLNAHTWSDGTALGNRLLAGLHRGDLVVAIGDSQARLCYRVTERVEVLAERGLPRYYAADGPPQLAIVVCSGRRLGPGQWEKRTVWFASPA